MNTQTPINQNAQSITKNRMTTEERNQDGIDARDQLTDQDLEAVAAGGSQLFSQCNEKTSNLFT